MRFEGAVVREQGVTFGIAVVRRGTLASGRRDDAIAEMSRAFGGIPTVLMEQDVRGTPTYFGRSDIVRFLANIDMRRISVEDVFAHGLTARSEVPGAGQHTAPDVPRWRRRG